MARAKGMPRSRGFSSVRRLSSKAAQYVGRPSPKIWGSETSVASKTKASVNRVIRRDPAKGRSLPLADKITDTHMQTDMPNPKISSRDKSAPVGKGKTRIRNLGTNRSLDKR